MRFVRINSWSFWTQTIISVYNLIPALDNFWNLIRTSWFWHQIRHLGILENVFPCSFIRFAVKYHRLSSACVFVVVPRKIGNMKTKPLIFQVNWLQAGVGMFGENVFLFVLLCLRFEVEFATFGIQLLQKGIWSQSVLAPDSHFCVASAGSCDVIHDWLCLYNMLVLEIHVSYKFFVSCRR